MLWTVVVPAKALPAAKSRLQAATEDGRAHAALVEAIRADTVAAAQAADVVARVLVVVDAASAPGQLLQNRPGLNGALADAAEHASRTWPEDGVAALVGDLPALRPEELAGTLRAAQRSPRGYVADVDGTGTTLLTAVPGVTLAPRFGPGSAAAHAADAMPLPAGAGLRHDVDTPQDLCRAAELGLGARTSALLGLDARCAR